MVASCSIIGIKGFTPSDGFVPPWGLFTLGGLYRPGRNAENRKKSLKKKEYRLKNRYIVYVDFGIIGNNTGSIFFQRKCNRNRKEAVIWHSSSIQEMLPI